MPTGMYAASSSSERASKIIDGIEQALSELFRPDYEPFAVTNEFLYRLIRSNAEVLRAAVESEDEERIFSQWNDYLMEFRDTLLKDTEYFGAALVRGEQKKVPIVDERQFKKAALNCPEAPKYPKRRR